MSFWGGRIPFHLAISLAVFAPSAAFLGASFAMAARLYVGLGRPVGASTGRLYGLNTLGAIVGAIVTTAWLIPGLGDAGSGDRAGLIAGGDRGPGDPVARRRPAGWTRASLRGRRVGNR